MVFLHKPDIGFSTKQKSDFFSTHDKSIIFFFKFLHISCWKLSDYYFLAQLVLINFFSTKFDGLYLKKNKLLTFFKKGQIKVDKASLVLIHEDIHHVLKYTKHTV